MDDYGWFCVLADEEHLSAAAARLGIAQPTLSRRLQHLEQELSAPLFDRVGRGLVLNDAGRIFADAARRSSVTLATAAQRIHELSAPDAAQLRLGFLHSLGPTLVPRVLTRLRQELPDLRPMLAQDAADTIAGRVLDGELDVAIISPAPTHHPRLAFRRIVSEPVGMALPITHPDAWAETVRLRDFAASSFVTMPPRFGMRRVLDEACSDAGIRPHIALECQELGTVAGLVAAGMGVALMPASHMLVTPDVRIVPLREPQLFRDICLIWPRDRALPHPARVLVGMDFGDELASPAATAPHASGARPSPGRNQSQ